MSDLQSSIQRMLNQMDSPLLKFSREFHQKMKAYQTPQIQSFLEENRKMQDLLSPFAKSILSSQDHLRLALNPNIKAFFEQQEKFDAILKPYQPELSGNIANLSKWIATTETPAAVYTEVASFKKELYSSALLFQQASAYQDYFDRLGHLGSMSGDISISSFNPNIFQRFDYTLIEDEDSEPESQIILLDEGSRIKRIIKDIYHNNHQLYTMQPNDFEDMIAELLRFQQFEVEMTKRTRDGGYDLIAVKNIGDFAVRFLVECKRNAKSRKIGVGIVRGFRDVINTQGANKGIIVTSSYFSPDAEKERMRNKPYMLDFKDHDDVIDWVNKYIN